jgi:hypothetical protein
LSVNANALEGCFSTEIELEPNKISQRSIPGRCASLILTSNKRGKGHQKDHFWPIGLWRGDLGRSLTKQKPGAYKKLELTRPHATIESNGSLHPRNPLGIKSGT